MDSDLLKGMTHWKVISSLCSKRYSPVSAEIFQSKAAGHVFFLDGSVWGRVGFSVVTFILHCSYITWRYITRIFRLNLCILFWLVFSEINIMLNKGSKNPLLPQVSEEQC